MFHLAAFYESLDPAGALTNIAAVQDQSLNVSGDDLTVPAGIPFLMGAAALTAAASFVRAQFQAPSLQTLAYADVSRLVNAVVFGGIPEMDFYASAPRRLAGDEDMQFLIQSTPGGGAEAHYGLAWLSDGPVTPVNGEIFTLRATGTAALAAGSWANTSITLGSTLPVGQYDIVGFRAVGTNLVAARLAFVGGGFRPGVPAVNINGDLGNDQFRMGRGGSFGSFRSTALPSVDCLGVTDSAQTFYFDLIKTG